MGSRREKGTHFCASVDRRGDGDAGQVAPGTGCAGQRRIEVLVGQAPELREGHDTRHRREDVPHRTPTHMAPEEES